MRTGARDIESPGHPVGEDACDGGAARRAGKSEVAVYLSYKLDPSSEIGDAGYRVVVRGDDGRTRGGSLGFAMLRPYVVLDNDKLPVLDGDVLQLSVDARELDDKSITFPPVALHATREAHDRMLRCPLASVFLDTDGDGLTDVEEARLATDPGDPDTHGDSVPDGNDPAPLGAAPSACEDARRRPRPGRRRLRLARRPAGRDPSRGWRTVDVHEVHRMDHAVRRRQLLPGARFSRKVAAFLSFLPPGPITKGCA